jgi:biotin carboxyl carrier protein
MRYYLIDGDNNDTVIDLEKTVIHKQDYMEFHFSEIKDQKIRSAEKTIYIRKLATKYFSSFDGIKWTKIARQDLPKELLNINQVYKMYRGFKPSGLGGAAEGDLVTQMPGKVVKILVQEGQEVSKGETLLILEAMKMENEIKASSDGVVKAIHVKANDAIESGHLMMEIES